MQTVTYTITVPALVGSGTSNSYTVPTLSGSADVVFRIAGDAATIAQARKFVFEFSNDPGVQYTLQAPLTGSATLSGMHVAHTFFSTALSATTYTASATSIRADLTYDTYMLGLTVLQPSLAQYSGVSIIKTVSFDTPTTSDNLLITAETNSPHQLVNFILPGNSIE